MGFRFVCVAAALVLAACSPEADGGSSAPAKSGEGVARPAQIAAGQVRLSGDTINVTGPAGTNLAFGSPRDVVEQELARALGPATDRTQNDECGAGPIGFTAFSGGLTVNFQDDKLVGWTLGREEGESPVRTSKDVGIGTSEQDLAKAYSVEQMAGSTLGDEFQSSEGIGGFFTPNGNGKVVESLFAGTNCFFR